MPCSSTGTGQQRRLEHLQRLDRPDVAGLVDRDLDARVDEHLRHEVERLLRPVGDEHLIGVDLAPTTRGGLLRDPRPQLGEPLGRRVLQQRRRVVAQQPRGHRPDLVDGKRIGCGQPTGHRDDVGSLRDREQLADRVRAQIAHAARERDRSHVHVRRITRDGWPRSSSWPRRPHQPWLIGSRAPQLARRRCSPRMRST